MTNEENARILNLILSGQQPKINEIFGLKPADILSVECMATPYQTTNTRALVKTANGTREFHYNRQALADAVNEVLGNVTIAATASAESVASAFTEAGLTMDETDLDVSPLGTTAVEVKCSKSNVRYHGKVNMVLGTVEPVEPEPEPEPPVTEPEPEPEVPVTPPTPATYKISVDAEPQLFVGDFNTPTTVAEMFENGTISAVTDAEAKTITVTLEGNYIGPAENADSLMIPLYFGDVNFYNDVMAQHTAGTAGNTPFVRMMYDDAPADVALTALLDLEVRNGTFTTGIALSSPSSTVPYSLSTDGFVTAGDAYTLIVNNNMVFGA